MLFTKNLYCTGCLRETNHAFDKELEHKYIFQCRECGNLIEWYKNEQRR